MKKGFSAALVLTGCLMAVPLVCAQTQPASGAAGSAQKQNAKQNNQAGGAQKPSQSYSNAFTEKSNSNAFPDNTSTIPVLPTVNTPAAPTGNGSNASGNGNGSGGSSGMGQGNTQFSVINQDLDPVRSPDDLITASEISGAVGSSSSLSGLQGLIPKPGSGLSDKKKASSIGSIYHASASQDISVGKFYLDRKNWKAALSRFQSALVLEPENPEVFWGLGEAERHMGQYAAARAHFLQQLIYDPDGPHSKDALKALKDPRIANAKTTASTAPNPTAPSAQPQK